VSFEFLRFDFRLSYVLEGKSRSKAPHLRQLVAQMIRADPFTYNEATLGRSTESYLQAIVQPNTWGGSVELAILASHYKTEIVAFDVINVRSNIFGALFAQVPFLLCLFPPKVKVVDMINACI